MARTRWPPGPVNPASDPGQADQTGSAGGCLKTGPGRQIVSQDNPRGRQPNSRSDRTRSPTLRPYSAITQEAEPEHYPHPPCRIGAREPSGASATCEAHISPFWVFAALLREGGAVPAGSVLSRLALPGGLSGG